MESQDSGISSSNHNLRGRADSGICDPDFPDGENGDGGDDFNLWDPISDTELSPDFNIEDELAKFSVDEHFDQESKSAKFKPEEAEQSGCNGYNLDQENSEKHDPEEASLKDLLGWAITEDLDMMEDSEMSNTGNANHDDPSDVSSSEDEAQDLHNSISSPGSFDSDSDKETNSKSTTEAKSPIKSPGETKNNSSPKDITSYMNQILRDTRYFLMKSNNEENVDLSKSKGVWSTPPANESKINQAVKETRNVILIFSVKESGQFSGFARVVDSSRKDGESIQWILPPGLSSRTLSSTFDLDWISKNELSFMKTQHLFNPWNEGKPVKIGRDGQEIEPHVAAELCRLFPPDVTTDWSKVTSRLKNSVNTRAGRISAPIGGTSPSFNSGMNMRGRGFPNRRPPRGFISPLQGSSRSFDYGRGRKRQFDDQYSAYDSRAKRGSYDSYSGGYSDMSDRYYHEPRSSYPAHKGSSRYQDYGAREYHHPPPVAPMPYPPPPPFDSLPPPPRYYDGPPLPDFPPAHARLRDRRSSSPYEKSVTDFLRRAGNRSHRDHDRDRKYYRH